uniref:Sushi domain-containing protein n=1 Tax=Pseudonaja textilis TaxID=8673 RepID=A0A670ZDI8_PSETE
MENGVAMCIVEVSFPVPIFGSLVQCLPPPDIQNGTHNNQKTGVFPSGIFVKYTCDPGYALIGETTLHCTNAGRWSSPAPNLVQCQPPPNIQNGTRSNQETAVFPSGMLVKYTCNPGYALIGEATIQCIDNGMWSSPAPTCEGTFHNHSILYIGLSNKIEAQNLTINTETISLSVHTTTKYSI